MVVSAARACGMTFAGGTQMSGKLGSIRPAILKQNQRCSSVASSRISRMHACTIHSTTSEAVFFNGERSNLFIDIEEYVSLKVVCNDNHELVVDWWAFKILIYEMIYGTTPFKGKNHKEPLEFIGKRIAFTYLIEELLTKDSTRKQNVCEEAVANSSHLSLLQSLKAEEEQAVIDPELVEIAFATLETPFYTWESLYHHLVAYMSS
ncbi:hypothetical protein VNO80_15082 [Phaseolus coccineus]|uniref:non-specific serine/threonine protein kinase n=1 Tax=Phaseolus coccineus TaxID=3886 RepID=A0AAN9QYZ6_PHACN